MAGRRPGRRCRRRRAGSTRGSSPAPSRSAASTWRGGHVVGHDQGDVLLGDRDRSRTPARGPRRRRAPSGSRGRPRRRPTRAGRPNAAQTCGCSSPAWPNSTPSDQDLRAAARVPRHPAGRGHLDLDAELGAQPADQPDGVRPARRAAGAPPAGALALAGQDHGQVQRLLGQRLEQLGQLVVAGPPVDAVDRAPGRGRPGTRRCRSRTATPPAYRGRGCGPRPRAGRAAASWCTTAPRPRAGWPAARSCAARRRRAGPSWSKAASPTNGKLITSTQPAPARVRPIRRRSRCSRVSPRPAASRGSTEGPGRSRRSGRPPRPGRRGR